LLKLRRTKTVPIFRATYRQRDDGEEIIATLLNVRRQIIRHKWTLTVPRLISEHDDGNYTCVVRNVHGLLQHTVFVEVIGTQPSLSRLTACYDTTETYLVKVEY